MWRYATELRPEAGCCSMSGPKGNGFVAQKSPVSEGFARRSELRVGNGSFTVGNDAD